MKYNIHIISDAEEDIFSIYKYVTINDSVEKAEYLIKNIEDRIYKLASLPNRGHYPPELERIDIQEYREIHFKPYRIIYTIEDTEAFIHCVLDGRRDLSDLLQKRLIR